MTNVTLTDIRYEQITLQIAALEAAAPTCRQRKAYAAYQEQLAQLSAERAALPICWHNFHEATRAVFEQVSLEAIRERQPDFISPSGSMYWRTATGVYRLSDHWGIGIRSCDWYLRGHDWQKASEYTTALAFCAYDDFLRDTAQVARYWMVAPDGSREQCIAAAYVRKGYTMERELVVVGAYHNYESCCAAKEAR